MNDLFSSLFKKCADLEHCVYLDDIELGIEASNEGINHDKFFEDVEIPSLFDRHLLSGCPFCANNRNHLSPLVLPSHLSQRQGDFSFGQYDNKKLKYVISDIKLHHKSLRRTSFNQPQIQVIGVGVAELYYYSSKLTDGSSSKDSMNYGDRRQNV
ncbi:hypothetical protein Nepgr_017638 [Nepenthes gracilis]|uniref:Uncharacterized protein n=1 Tax=Nepenthes gracilis TaxID=150966 RepID=A0AAD3SSP6_NEPGR|nr:hypothetical protein Nepgr_017638 [Nepenthes gracilis]